MGRICHEILNKFWSPMTSIVRVLMDINDMIHSPNPDDYMERIAASQYREFTNLPTTADKDEHIYKKTIKEWCKEYAYSDRAKLCADYKCS